jgi:methionine-rich copper-binding protein CopC
MSIKRFIYRGLPAGRGRGAPTVIGRLAAVVTLAALAGLLGAGQAAGHDSLVSADPADGATLPAGPQQVRLTFDQPVQREFATITVTGPGNTRWDSGEAVVSGNSVTAPVRPLGPPGEYVVGYRIVSADGHPVSGTLTFRLTAAGAGTQAGPPPSSTTGTGTQAEPPPSSATGTGTQAEPPPSSATGAAAGAAGSADDGMPVWPWLAAAVLLLGAGVLLTLRLRRPNR